MLIKCFADFGAMNQRYPLKEITVYKGLMDIDDHGLGFTIELANDWA